MGAAKESSQELSFQAEWILVPVVILGLWLIYTYIGENAMSVKYKVNVNDQHGNKKDFEFLHPLRRRGQLRHVMADEQRIKMMVQYMALEHEKELLAGASWRCIECGKKAEKLVFHPMPYLHLAQPMVIDLPGPVCKSQKCQKTHKKCFGEMMDQVNAAVPPTTEHRD
mmetsp:Transcript_2641/g.6622  ORF Transcript_2641/g.6622 Transcript_2641/m.6622 type:complete len:168 (+) Transcript_2641:306-809(+)